MADEYFDSEKALLDSVNILLESINELPIENEEDYELVIEARQARNKIIEVKRAVLSEKWDFNQDKNWIMSPNIEGFIPVPANMLDVTADRGDIISRNWRLYSRKNQSHVFTEEVKVDVVWDLDFNSITAPLRHYITIRAARIFASKTIGDKNEFAFNSEDEEDARLSARRSESRTGQYNMLNSTYGINNLARLN